MWQHLTLPYLPADLYCSVADQYWSTEPLRQASVATHFSWNECINVGYVHNIVINLPVKTFRKSAHCIQSYNQKSNVCFFRHSVYIFTGYRYHSTSPSELLMMFDCSCSLCLKYFGDVYTPLLPICDYSEPTIVTSSSHRHCPLGLAAAVSACEDEQFGTNLHRICKALTLGNSLNIGWRA